MTVVPPAYDEVAALLSAYGDAFGAAECHGMLCAMASCQPGLDGDSWARRMLGGEVEAVLEGEMSGGAEVDSADREALSALYDDTVRQLADPELGFQLLLPDDEVSLQQRTAALASWCQGYLYGLSLGGIKDFQGFSEPVQEFARDLAEIARLSHDEEDDAAAGESAFLEVSEYVRMGVLMLRDELLNEGGEGPESPGAPEDVVLH
ncbi:hypothetical protein Tel_01780 [Candidatus Tenderia electrophaga]|uniref:YecA family protein n=1 Tax=Candidatus Tenderia electrophaga TaxID=1748243 RepID=A0A0S2T9Z9_9GAMM|nr:hypothetical protein Tel_01780 [Candidatus Tenderia electrophaga]